MNPAFEDEKPFNPFDFWSGANFKLKIRKVDGFWNYDKSEFEAPAFLNQDDAVIKETWAKQHPLKPFLEAANFKSYDDLKEKLNRVISGSKNTETASDIDLPPAGGVLLLQWQQLRFKVMRRLALTKMMIHYLTFQNSLKTNNLSFLHYFKSKRRP